MWRRGPGRTDADVMRVLGRARTTMFDARAKRPRPHLDDKIITAWNGLMIAAAAGRRVCSWTARGGPNGARRPSARRRRFSAHLWRPAERLLLRRLREGEAAIDGFCEDYACLAWGLIELFQATGHGRWLDWAVELTDVQTERFFDARDGGWFSTTGEDPSVLLRLKEDYDGAEPAAASVTVRNLIALSHLLGDAALSDRAKATLERYGPQIGQVVRVMPLMVSNIALWHAPKAEIVIAGADAEAARALEVVAARRYLPWALTMAIDADRADPARDARLPQMAPIIASASGRGGATAFVCAGFTCQAPVSDPEALDRQLEAIAGPRRIIAVTVHASSGRLERGPHSRVARDRARHPATC